MKADIEQYENNFEDLCRAIAEALGGGQGNSVTVDRGEVYAKGKVSWFGGPDDMGVAPNEGLAFIYEIDDAPRLFLPKQPAGTSGLARRLDPNKHYIAMRWDYDMTSKNDLLKMLVLVRAPETGKMFLAKPADWGPHEDTGRIADISPGLMEALGITTDDEVEVIFRVKPTEA